MNKSFVVLCSVVIGLSGCNSPTSPDLEFSKMEIHYTKIGGWINTSKLDIYGSGLVEAYHIGHASTEVLDSASTFLSQEAQRKIASLFESFSSYDSYYEPVDYGTDQNLHTTVFIYDREPDTVAVYQPERANIPSGLGKMIEEMESMWESIFEW